MTIPNLITVFRLLLVPAIVGLIGSGSFEAALWVFVLAGISDGVDGFLAKHFDMESELGAYLDPIADKALLVSIYVILTMIGEIPLWLTLMVVSRDVLIVGGVLLSWIMERPVKMSPLYVSKSNTVAQIVYASLVMGDLAFSFDLSGARSTALVFVAVLTVLSAAAYLVEWFHHMTDDGASPDADGPAGDRLGEDRLGEDRSGEIGPGGKAGNGRG